MCLIKKYSLNVKESNKGETKDQKRYETERKQKVKRQM